MIKASCLFAALVLTGCVGSTSEDIRAQPVQTFKSHKQSDEVVQCLGDKMNYLRDGRLQVTPLISSSSTEFLVGASQMLEQHYYQRIVVKTEVDKSSIISLQSSDSYFRPLTKDKAQQIIQSCI